MKKNECVCKAVLLACCCLFSLPGIAALKTIGLTRALDEHLLDMKATGKGGAMGKCLDLHLLNLTKDDLTVLIEPGMVFTTADSVYQDLVVVGGDFVDLPPQRPVDMVLQTFCGKADGLSPRPGLEYSFLYQGDSAMIKTLDFIRDNNLFNGLGQRTVWTFTSGHCLGTIYEPGESDTARRLLQLVASLRHVPLPDYYTYFTVADRPGYNMINVSSVKQYVEMHWADEGYRNMYLTVYKADGEVYSSGTKEEQNDAYGHTATLVFDPKKEKGRYYVTLRDDHNQVWSRKEVIVGGDMGTCL